ncbi:DUF58 domain-containing protein [uncultured Pseudoteredinibacter sp.]|uniref:DUF58 domain-containing protein n=1 Tax=uncultured Pseudoteredinibacter sp. TaxID=1641701 RepID=UPI00262F703E|nr:DUF58 domain-containing protein [uncultured Pseudoteredinibacter sp.]
MKSNQDLQLDGSRSDLASLLQLRHPAQELNIYSRQYSRSVLLGQQRTSQRGRGMEFEEVRQYQAGDDVRTIDWRVTARTQVPHTKLFREERERPVLLVCDLRPNMYFGSQVRFKSVQLANLAAQLAWAAIYHKDRVGGLVFNAKTQHDIRPARSKHRVMELLHTLCDDADLDLQQDAIGIADILLDSRRVARPGSAVFILSDFHDFDDAAHHQLHCLARHIDVSCIKISDPLESQLSKLHGLSISDGKQRSQLSAGQALRDFERQQINSTQLLEQACKKSAVELLHCQTNDNPVAFLKERFSQKIKRRGKNG